jgi:boron transporter
MQIATIFWTGFSHINGRIQDTPQLRIPHSTAFYPTVDRPWLVDFWNLPVKWVFVALPIGILLTLLFYYDHNVSSLTAQAKQFPLTKPAGFHWDFFLLGITCFIGGIIGIPLPNGLVPQAPVHTDSCTVYQDKLKITKEKEDDPPDAEWEQHNKKIIDAVSVKEQRVSHWLMALALIGMMTGPLLDVLHTMPRSLFAGVFFVVGWPGVGSLGIAQNIYFIFREKKFIDPSEPRLRLKKGRIAFYISFQLFGVLSSVAISQTIAAIGFPVIIISLIPLRWVFLPRIFTEEELLILDAPTADADVVLASMGGQPTRPEVLLAEKKRQQKNKDGEEGPSSSTSGYNSGMMSREVFKDEEEKEIENEQERRRQEEGVQGTHWTGHD